MTATTIENGHILPPKQSMVVSEGESKRQKFLRLANKRLDDAMDSIRLLENLLQNPYAYQYDYHDVEVIAGKLNNGINRLKLYWRVKN